MKAPTSGILSIDEFVQICLSYMYKCTISDFV